MPDRLGRSSVGVVPVARPGSGSCLVVHEAVLEEVEDGKLVAGHDVRARLGGYPGPDCVDGTLEDLGDCGILSTIQALTGNLQSLGNGCFLLRRQGKPRRSMNRARAEWAGSQG